jgi:uncharacterized membrane protein
MSSTRKRSIVKALGYRLFTIPADTIAYSILLMIFGVNPIAAISLSFSLSTALELLHVGWYYIYERIWNRIQWGRTIGFYYTKEDYRGWLRYRMKMSSKWRRWYWKLLLRVNS